MVATLAAAAILAPGRRHRLAQAWAPRSMIGDQQTCLEQIPGAALRRVRRRDQNEKTRSERSASTSSAGVTRGSAAGLDRPGGRPSPRALSAATAKADGH